MMENSTLTQFSQDKFQFLLIKFDYFYELDFIRNIGYGW